MTLRLRDLTRIVEDIDGIVIMVQRTILGRTSTALDHYFHGMQLLNGPQSLTQSYPLSITYLPLIGTARRDTYMYYKCYVHIPIRSIVQIVDCHKDIK